MSVTTYKVQAPDGSILTIDGPVGASDEQLIAVASEHYKNLPTTGMSTAERVKAGAGKAVVDAGLGIEQAAGDIASKAPLPLRAPMMVGNKVRELITGRTPEVVQADVDESRRLDAPLMNTTAGKVGHLGGNVALAAPTMMVPGANTYAGSAVIGSLMGLINPTADDESRGVNTALGGALGMAGKYGADKLSGWVKSGMDAWRARGASQATADSVKNTVAAASREEGYVLPPTQANPSAWNRLVEGLSGKIQTGQHASVKNQRVTNRLAAEAIGMPADQPLTVESLKQVRSQAGQAYDAIAAGQYVTDATFKKNIASLAESQAVLARQFPELADDTVIKLAQNLDQPGFDGRTLIEVSKALREKATKAFQDGATDAGRFYRGAASELEDLIERNLLYTGSGGQNALKSFQEARQLIAKTYSIEGALGAGGNVSAQKLAAQLQKGKPLSDGLETAAQFGQQFPKAAQVPEKMGSVLPGSPLDWMFAGGASAYTGDPNMLALLAARPGARALLLSRPYQAAMTTPSYGPGTGMRALEQFVTGPTRKLAPAAAASAALAE